MSILGAYPTAVGNEVAEKVAAVSYRRSNTAGHEGTRVMRKGTWVGLGRMIPTLADRTEVAVDRRVRMTVMAIAEQVSRDKSVVSRGEFVCGRRDSPQSTPTQSLPSAPTAGPSPPTRHRPDPRPCPSPPTRRPLRDQLRHHRHRGSLQLHRVPLRSCCHEVQPSLRRLLWKHRSGSVLPISSTSPRNSTAAHAEHSAGYPSRASA